MIGILAGMGPKSTAPFVDKVVELCQQLYGAKYDIEFPPMMIYSCPTPFFMDRPLDHKAMETAIISGTRRLAATGADFVAIPCNTAHRYFENIKGSVEIPVLNMVEETLKYLPAGCGRVALLATPSTLEAGVYQSGLAGRGCEYVQRDAWQERVNAVIAAVKGADGLSVATATWRSLLDDLGGQVDALILACTDLNVAADQCPTDIMIIDAGHCLARAVVDRYYQDRGGKKRNMEADGA